MFKDKAAVARIYYLVFVGIYGLMALSGANFGAGILSLSFGGGRGLVFFSSSLTPMVLAVLVYFLTTRSYRQLKQRTYPQHEHEFRWHKEAIDQQPDDVMLLEISRLFKDTIYETYSQLKEGLDSGMAVSRFDQLQLVDGALHMRAEDLTNLVMLAQQNGDIRKVKQGLDNQYFNDRPVKMVFGTLVISVLLCTALTVGDFNPGEPGRSLKHVPGCLLSAEEYADSPGPKLIS